MNRRHGQRLARLLALLAGTVGHAVVCADTQVLALPDLELMSSSGHIERVAPAGDELVVRGRFQLADGVRREGWARLDGAGRLVARWQARGLPCLELGTCPALSLATDAYRNLMLCGPASLSEAGAGGLVRLFGSDGQLDRGWRPLEALGLPPEQRQCYAVQASHDRIYVVAGPAASPRLFALDALGGQPLPAFVPPEDGVVTLLDDGQWLYARPVGGGEELVRYDRDTGRRDPGWRVGPLPRLRVLGLDRASGSIIADAQLDPEQDRNYVRIDLARAALDPAWHTGVALRRFDLPEVVVGNNSVVIAHPEQFSSQFRMLGFTASSPATRWMAGGLNARDATQFLGVDHANRPLLSLLWPRSPGDPTLQRLRPDGSIDSGFTPRLTRTGTVVNLVPDRGGTIGYGGIELADGTPVACGSLRVTAEGLRDVDWQACPRLGSSGFVSRRATALGATAGGDLLLGGWYWSDTGFTYAYLERLPSRARTQALVPVVTRPFDPRLTYGGQFLALAHDAPTSTVIVGGNFTGLVCGAPRQNLMRVIDDTECVLDGTWAPEPDGPVSAIARAPDGGWYVAGAFSEIGGVATGPLARLAGDAAGSVDASFAPLARIELRGAAALPKGIVLDGANLILHGDFDTVDGSPRAGLARIDLATGQLDPQWAPDLGAPVGAVVAHAGSVYAVAAPGAWNAPLPDRVLRIAARGDGRVDPGFRLDTDGDVTALAITGRPALRLGGTFRSVAGVARYGLADAALPEGLSDGFE